HVTRDAAEPVAGAHCVVADTWVSMGDDVANRHNLLATYQIDAALMARASGDAIFMHCLPAQRGEGSIAEVMDGPQWVIFDEAEIRLHTQKAILRWCLQGYSFACNVKESRSPNRVRKSLPIFLSSRVRWRNRACAAVSCAWAALLTPF